MATTRRRISLICLCLALGVGCLVAATARSDVPTAPEARAKVVGQPAGVVVQPEKITLNGPRATQQLVISGRYADGNLRDLTHFAEVTVEGADVVGIDAERFLTAKKNGTT